MLFTTRFLPCRDRKLAMRVVGNTRANTGKRRPVQDKIEAWLESMPEDKAREWAKFIDWVEIHIENGSICIR
ncbi:hypothetical protein KAR91_54870 [Candidatus Pacearchaeota archaeon]|nr:hypothetical protein [Candidatus Pacearchaeota archaeon]